MKRLLLADDDQVLRSVLKASLDAEGFDICEAEDGRAALELVKSGDFDAIVLDIMMPELSGFDVFKHTKRYAPQTPVILMSANATFTTSMEASEAGAFDYLPKPFDLKDLSGAVNRAINSAANINSGRDILKPSPANTPKLLGKSAAMQEVFKMISRLSSSNLSVLLTGESGTGKEVVARTIHAYSPVKNGPFVAVNMAAVPTNLIESELFGHEKGAFTGADRRKTGRFEQACGGTLFLDEIGDMPVEAQTRLLRVLQEEEFTPLGSTHTVKSNVRIICATHKDLAKAVKNGNFRQDLYYRLNVIPISIPPLRHRQDDVFDLAKIFLEEIAPDKSLHTDVEKLFKAYDWPGNVRELKNVMARIAIISEEGNITPEDASPLLHSYERKTNTDNRKLRDKIKEITQGYLSELTAHKKQEGDLYAELVAEVERPLIELTLKETGGNQIKAAKILGLNRNTLRAKIRAHDLKIVKE